MELLFREESRLADGRKCRGYGYYDEILRIIAVFKSKGMQILLAAPTGRAAKRMTEATGMEAKTIHRLPEYNPMEGCKRNDENPLEGDTSTPT